MQRLLVYQSLWAMERRRPDGAEWSLDQKLEMIREAGFDGAGVRFFDAGYAKTVTERLGNWGLTWQAQCYPQRIDDLGPILQNVKAYGAEHVNLQADVRPKTVAECVPLLEGWTAMARDAGVKLFFETHRDRMTTDLFFTLRLLDRFPDIKFTADLSHYLLGREFSWPVSAENHGLIHRILDNSFAFHGRVASREQIQVQISFAHHKEWLELFLAWWEYGLRSWRRRAGKDDVVTFLCEMGPKEYAMTGADGYELSDRWEESKMLMRLIRELWSRLEQEDAPRKSAESLRT